MRSRAEHWSTRTGTWLLAFVVPASALAIGSLLVDVLLVVALLAAVSCGLLWLRPPARISTPSRWLVLAFAVLVLVTVAQSVPLPAGLVRVLAPANADAWARSLAPLQEAGPAIHPLTLAPVATRVEVLRGLLYGCVFLGALRVASADGGSSFLERVILVSTGIVAVSTLLHPAFHAERVFGVYAPRDLYGYYPGRIGPLLNANHVAAYVNIGACVAIGAALDGRTLPRPVALSAAVLLAATAIWAGSRGGMGGTLLGVVIVGGLAALRRGGHFALRRGELFVTMFAVLAAGVMTALAVSDAARGEMFDTDTSKIHIALSGLRLVPLAPLTGAGRGAFETVFPLFREGAFYATQTHPENVVVQWLTEWGIPVSIGAAAMIAFALRPKVVLLAARPAFGAWAAVVVTVLHDVVDFHLEVPGVVVAAAVCAASVVGARAFVSDRGPRHAWPRMFRGAALATAAAVPLAAGAVLPDRGHSLAEERSRVARMSIDRNVPAERFRATVREAMLRFPAEPYFPLAGAIRAQTTGEGSVVPWVGRALERYPAFGRAHLVLANALAKRNRSQARLEYRLAYAEDIGLREAIAKEAPALVDDFDSAMELVTAGVAGDTMLEQLADVLGSRLPATVSRLDAELLRRRPTATGPVRRRARAALSDLVDGDVCESASACAERALEATTTLVAREPEKCESRLLAARVRIAMGQKERAFHDLRIAIDTSAERSMCLRAMVELALEHKLKARAEQAMDLAIKSGCGTTQDCIELYTWAAGTEEEEGRLVRAANFYRKAQELAPDRDHLVERRAQVSIRAGLYAQALEAYETLSHRHPDDLRWRREAEAVKAKVREQLAAPR